MKLMKRMMKVVLLITVLMNINVNAATCSSWSCTGADQILKSNKETITCEAGGCDDVKCCKLATCGSSGYHCYADGQILDPAKTSNTCADGTCHDSTCCELGCGNMKKIVADCACVNPNKQTRKACTTAAHKYCDNTAAPVCKSTFPNCLSGGKEQGQAEFKTYKCKCGESGECDATDNFLQYCDNAKNVCIPKCRTNEMFVKGTFDTTYKSDKCMCNESPHAFCNKETYYCNDRSKTCEGTKTLPNCGAKDSDNKIVSIECKFTNTNDQKVHACSIGYFYMPPTSFNGVPGSLTHGDCMSTLIKEECKADELEAVDSPCMCKDSICKATANATLFCHGVPTKTCQRTANIPECRQPTTTSFQAAETCVCGLEKCEKTEYCYKDGTCGTKTKNEKCTTISSRVPIPDGGCLCYSNRGGTKSICKKGFYCSSNGVCSNVEQCKPDNAGKMPISDSGCFCKGSNSLCSKGNVCSSTECSVGEVEEAKAKSESAKNYAMIVLFAIVMLY